MRKIFLPLVGLALALTACGGQATEDRKGSSGSKPDKSDDVTHVTIWRNADSVPNVAHFCTGAIGWASTLSGTDSGENKAATLIRLPEYDGVCGGSADEAEAPARR